MSIGVAPDGTVSAATPAGTLVVQLSGGPGGTADVVMSVQQGLAARPKELDRYRVRDLLAFVLRVTSPRRRSPRPQPLQLAARLPSRLHRAQQLALAQFVCINFEAMMIIAHAWPHSQPLAFVALA